jgi:hypothetical protein
MPEYVISIHAKEQIEARGISEETVFETLEYPDSIINEEDGQFIFQKIVSFENGKDYLVQLL